MSDQVLHPIVIHKGKRNKGQLRKLKKGRGKLVTKIEQTLERVQAKVGDENKILVPIVVHYTLKKSPTATTSGSFFGN